MALHLFIPTLEENTQTFFFFHNFQHQIVGIKATLSPIGVYYFRSSTVMTTKLLTNTTSPSQHCETTCFCYHFPHKMSFLSVARVPWKAVGICPTSSSFIHCFICVLVFITLCCTFVVICCARWLSTLVSFLIYLVALSLCFKDTSVTCKLISKWLKQSNI